MSQNQNCGCNEVKPSITLPVTGFRLPGFGIGIDVDATALSPGIASETPDLQIGVEVKIPMKYMGRQVYAQLVNFGNFPKVGLKSVPHNIQNIHTITVEPAFSITYDSTKTSTLPYSHLNGNNGLGQYVAVNKQNIEVITSNAPNTPNVELMSAVYCVYYTKTIE